jgi:hypothetical protein
MSYVETRRPSSAVCAPHLPIMSLLPYSLGRQLIQEQKVHHHMAECWLECVCSVLLHDTLTALRTANDVMTIANLIHLGLLTGRTTILPPFAPSHVGRDAPLVPFSEIFDVPRMSATFRQPFVEWHEVKDIDSTEIDTLGCWSVWDAVRKEGPRDSLLYKVQNLGAFGFLSFCVCGAADVNPDISYTSVPEWAALGSDSHVTFARLSKLGFPEWRSRSLSGAKPSPLMQTVLEPDEQLLCYDFLYFVSTDEVRNPLCLYPPFANPSCSLMSTSTTTHQHGTTS